MRIQGPRTFLARPFWRDYVLSYVLIGFGFTLTSPSFPMLLRAVGALLGIGGVVVPPTASGDIRDLAVTVDGKFLLTGSIPASGETNWNVTLTRLNLNGTVDAAFGTGGITITDALGHDDTASRVLTLPDGKILVAGKSNQNILLARYQGGAPVSNPPAVSAHIISGVLKITGTAASDVIRVLRSGSTVSISGVAGSFASSLFSRIEISGLEGDDLIDMTNAIVSVTADGGAGRDTILGGAGDDSIIGRDGADGLFGGQGRDTLTGGAGDDYLNAGPGRDTIFGGAGKDQVLANDGEIDVIDLAEGFDGARVDPNDAFAGVESVLK